ncbi:MAG: alpha/beta hydrolase family protein [Cypionkella sp.]
MRNLSDTGSYTFVDHVLSRAVYSLSRLVGVKNITTPFWNRWRTSAIGEETLKRFLNNIHSLNDWPVEALRLVEEDERALAALSADTPVETRVTMLRRLSYLAHLAQWGTLPINDAKRTAYKKSRDYYVAAEELANAARFRRLSFEWQGMRLWANLHLAEDPKGPLVVVLHGMDDTKEEHLSTELAMVKAGFSIICIDGPGQGEALLLDHLTWPPNFHELVTPAIDAAIEAGANGDRVGIVGISWGGFWVYRAAAFEARIAAVFDLGGPVDAARFGGLPFFLKSKFCQALGVTGPDDIPDADMVYSLRSGTTLQQVQCPVMIVHGDHDPMVPVSDKQWVLDTLVALRPGEDLSLKVIPGGDHCCTGNADEVRNDAVRFFARHLR